MTTTQSQSQSQSTLPTPGTYTVDPVHSSLGFVVRHLVASKVRGSFTEFDGTVVVGATPGASSVTASAKADSITTNQAQRDEHLRSSDFLETATYPELTFVSTRVSARPDGRFDLVGDLTIHGITKEVTFDLEYLGEGPGMAPNTTVVGFEARTSIDRRDFGVSFNGTLENGSFVVSNKVELELAIEASAQR
ncbi:MAG TPA: YceI family protein [Acidimicrobiales bacterium]|jgi:polyisoprenoid-binding protein YceI|nr:YceI family protein [Acidimicrobiales bacterium]